ncbi:hypothetical protein [Brachybacterium subflavum]|uniref:hypothetical protein n=1 Tax=Brachybacterium subflavum TaxID=2585206 RepID=UPI0018791356|nr:hypothetical protein [Brachybacterium subflavum]
MLTRGQERAIVQQMRADLPQGLDSEQLASDYVALAWDMFEVLVVPDDARIAVARYFG